MIIKTSQPIVADRNAMTDRIGKFWNQISEAWHVIWGKHIHHGYYENNQIISHQDAQEKLILKLTELLHISQKTNILDVGCGMGGSSVYLAKQYCAQVIGITLSQRQVQLAEAYAQKINAKNVIFKVEDALSLSSIPDKTVDIVWSLESCEQFYDKDLFIKQAFRVLKENGKLMLATWCSNSSEYEGLSARKYRKLCLAFDVPYMPTIEYYASLLNKNNFLINTSQDWTSYVEKSWDIGLSLVHTYSFLKLLKLAGWRGLRFAMQLKLMRDAFQENRMKYGVFIATKKQRPMDAVADASLISS